MLKQTEKERDSQTRWVKLKRLAIMTDLLKPRETMRAKRRPSETNWRLATTKLMVIMKGLPKRWVTETVKPTLTARVKRWEIMMDWLTHSDLEMDLRRRLVKAKPKEKETPKD